MRAGPGRAARALLGGLVLLTAVACTSDDDPDVSPTTSPDGVEGGGTLRLGIEGDLIVDPVEASLASPRDLMVVDLLHDGLTRLDGEGVPQPALATRWVANPDLTAFRFRLAPDATFASGRQVTPDDVIASLERVIAGGDSSLVALSLEAVTGFRAFVEGEAEHVSGLTAPDDETVHIALETPMSVLPEVLSSPLLSVVDPDTMEGDDLAALDLSGAWAVAAAEDGGMVVERREEAPGSLDAVELRRYDDEEAAFSAFEDGDVDWAAVPSSRYADAVEDYGDAAFAPFHAELFFGMNLSSAALGTAALREAIVLAIDREAIVTAVYPDLADPLPTIVPAGVVGHDPDRCPGCAHDPDKAANIVQFAYPDGAPTVHIDFDESAAQQRMAELIAADLDAVGIPTDLRPLPLEEYKRFVVSGSQDLFSFGWIGAYGSPDAYLAPLFGSAANDNLTDYRSPQVDGYLSRARASDDRAKNGVRWAAAESIVLEDSVVVPIAQFRTQVVVAERVEGLAHAVDGSVDWSQVRLTS